MRDRMLFTKKALAALPPAPAGRRQIYHDTKLPFLKCRVTDAGVKSLIVSAKIRGRSLKRMVCRFHGDERDPSMEIIRGQAISTLTELERTVGLPAPKTVPTFGEYAKTWGESAEMRAAVSEEWRHTKLRTLEIHCTPLMDIRLDQISRSDVRALLTAITNRGNVRTARVVRTILNQVFELALDDGAIPENCSIPIPRNLKLKKSKRDRHLNQDELERFIEALLSYPGNPPVDPFPARLAILLALITAQRRGNILGMRWEDIDSKAMVWNIPAGQTKTRRHYRVPLHGIAWDLLQQHRRTLLGNGLSGPWVFPNQMDPASHVSAIKRAWGWVVRRAGLEDFRFHDLRHTAASIAFERDRDLLGVQQFLQHADSRTTADVYIHTSAHEPVLRGSDSVAQAILGAGQISAKELEERVFRSPKSGPKLDDDAA